MTIIIRRRALAKAFEDSEGKPLATLRGKRFWDSALVVLDPAGRVVCEADRMTLPGRQTGSDVCYVIRRGGVTIASGLPEYEAGADHFAPYGPPRARGLVIDMPDGRWRLQRGPDNSVDILAGSSHGHISPFFALGGQQMTIPDEADPYLWMAAYALAYFMMREDDRSLV